MSNTRMVKGVLGEKLGMTQVWDADNRLIPVTVIQVGVNVVTQVRGEADGYAAVQLGYGEIDPRKVNKPRKGHFERAGVTPRRHLVELRTADAADYALGQEVTVEVFEAGQAVDATGTTQGKGRMGGVRQTTQNLTVHSVDAERGLLLVKGAVPGARGGVVLVRTSSKEA
jgi:large subunit ribosomal protein L3